MYIYNKYKGFPNVVSWFECLDSNPDNCMKVPQPQTTMEAEMVVSAKDSNESILWGMENKMGSR